jgi:sigma-B regulation protein RsbU (phosphoserine phosphatase)
MDFRVVLKTTLVYTATMGLVAGLYLGIAYGVGQALGAIFGEMFEAVEIFIFVLFMMLFEPVKRQVQTAIENRFFPQRRDYSSYLASYSAEIAETVGSVAVADRTARTLKSVLDLPGVYVAVENQEGILQLIAKASDLKPIEIEQSALDALSRILYNSHSIISLETVNEPLLADLQRWFSYAVGLYAQGRVIGAVVMTRPKDDESLSGSQIPFIAGITAQGASAIEVARLYEEELKRQRYLEELATARRIQESLLPSRMPEIEGISISAVSTPANSVGGDYYDVIRLGDDQFLVIIADVSGKGLPASLYMAEFHGMVHVAASISSRPQEILKTLNKHLCEIIAASSFITATLLLFDTARRTVSFARAGHTPMIRRNGPTVDTLTPAGIALGLAPQELFASSLHEYTVEYEPGETFILYSDGVSEAMNSRHEEFGDGRLLDVISAATSSGAEALCERILSHVEIFRGGAEQNDDITLVVIEIEKERNDMRVAPALQVGERA